MTLPLLVIAGQLADGLAYQLVHGRPGELNPGAVVLITAYGPTGILAVKVAGGLVLGFGAWAIRRHRAVVGWLAFAGFAGALTELAALR